MIMRRTLPNLNTSSGNADEKNDGNGITSGFWRAERQRQLLEPENQLRSYSGGPEGMGTMSLSFHSLH